MNDDKPIPAPKPTVLNHCYLLHVLFMQAGIPTPRADAYDAHEIARLDAANEEKINGQA